jgi:replicative DNA helicase
MGSSIVVDTLIIYQREVIGCLCYDYAVAEFRAVEKHFSANDIKCEYARVIFKSIKRMIGQGATSISPSMIEEDLYNQDFFKIVSPKDFSLFFFENMNRVAPVNFDFYLRRAVDYFNRWLIHAAASQVEDPNRDVESAINFIDDKVVDYQVDAQSKTMTELSKQMSDHIDLHINHDPSIETISTGIPAIDFLLEGGMEKGKFVIFGARPSTGKTTVALQIAAHVAKQKDVLFFSVEMNSIGLMKRLCCSQLCVTLDQFRKVKSGDCSTAEKMREQMKKNEALRLIINDQSTMTIENLVTISKQHLKDNPDAGLIVIDYLQILKNKEADKFANRNDYVANISRQLKKLSTDLSVPVLAACQLKREGKDKPTLSDLRESGQLEQDADIVVMMSRDTTVGADASHIIFEVAKNRDGAALNNQIMVLNGKYFRFENFII